MTERVFAISEPLVRHPAGESTALRSVTAHVRRTAGALRLRYVARGEVHRLAVPDPAPARRGERLWARTCAEAFVTQSKGYSEFNFSPSGEWAAYAFSGYREGMEDIPGSPVVSIQCVVESGAVILEALIEDSFSDLGVIGLSFVEEDVEGRKSYWALSHADGPPDFHHPSSICLPLPPSEPA